MVGGDAALERSNNGAYPFSVAQHSLLVCDLVDSKRKSAAVGDDLAPRRPEYVISGQ